MFPQESEARNLFALYMVGANPFIPLFDPIADTFDSLRRRSAFCLVTILYIALCQTESDTVAGRNEESENKKKAAGQISRLLATESLFEIPARIESVQAMILLAAFSEKVWFAIGHALQMALDLGLDESFDRITKEKSSSPAETYTLLQRTRTWLILYHIEREFAFGTSKKPRIANISISALRKLYNMDITTSSDIRYISIIELVQLRGM
ncbi:unnamed protein product [Clonostachys solani]|uniref:Xylanolytic transcriptional activator regulatory domain-containing protein n=1 Tax=Clonostachys solani TaxID=160281 RepID=A0A9N9ZIH0_9HYPO|nr:unnamed protein product [Clonostachys solani]